MTALVDLFPNAQASRHPILECAVEAVEQCADELAQFTVKDVCERIDTAGIKPIRNAYGAVEHALRSFEANGLIRRLQSRPPQPRTWETTS